MKKFFLLLFVAVAIADAQAPTVTITSVDSISHSVARIHFNVSAGYNQAETIIVPTALGNCSAGTVPAGGWVQPGFDFVTTDARITVGGLLPNTQYMVCPGATVDNVNWGYGSVTFTTLPLPAVHPAIPIAPQTFDTSYPSVTATPNVIDATNNCNNAGNGLQAAINAALADQKNHDQIIEIPAGAVCIGRYTFSDTNLGNQPDLRVFSPTSIAVGPTNTITIPGHGFTDGQQVIFGNVYGINATPPTISTANPLDPCSLAGTFVAGEDYYYVHVVDANTIQLYCTATQADGTQASNRSLIQFANQGGGPNPTNHFLLAPWPRVGMNQIIVRTQAADSQLPPEHTRIGPQWASQMAVIEKPANANGSADGSPFAGMAINDIDSNTEIPITNIRFVGIEFTTQQSDAQTAVEPNAWETLVHSYPWVSNLIFDRCWLHGQPNPERYTEALLWEGKNTAWVDSYWDNLNLWHAMFSGLAASFTSNSFTVGSGSYVYGTATRKGTLSTAATVTISGTGSGPFLTYFDLSGNFHAVLPAGETGTCSGNANCTVTTSSTLSGTGTCDYNDTRFPTNGAGHLTVAPIACGTIASGSVTAFTNRPASGYDNGYGEGSSNISGKGPGPMMLVNNYIEGTGIAMHFDDGGSLVYYRHDYTIERNRFVTLFQHQYLSPNSDGMRYGNRQDIEWKGGSIISFQGNIFDGQFAEDSNNGVFVTFSESGTANSEHDDWGIQDVDMENNTFMHGPGLVEGPGFVQAGLNHQMTPSVRFRFANNLAWDINSFVYNPFTAGTSVHGTLWYFLDGGEDYVIDHNTVAGNFGGYQGDVFVGSNSFLEGLRVTNNIFQIDTLGYCLTPPPPGNYGDQNCTHVNGGVMYQVNGSFGTPYGTSLAPSGNGQQTADAIFPGYQWTNNALVPGPGTTQAQVQSYWPNTSSWANHNYFPASNDMTQFGFVNLPATALGSFVNGDQGVDLHLVSGSPYANAASDGTALGANIDTLNQAQGYVSGVSAGSITSASAAISFTAPDTQSCPVDFSSTDPTLISSFTRVSDPGTLAGARSVPLGTLAASTTYYYRIDCAVNQPTGTFVTLASGGGGGGGGGGTPGAGGVLHTGKFSLSGNVTSN